MTEDRFEIGLETNFQRLPAWLHIKIPKGDSFFATKEALSKECHTICSEGNCPNRLECFHKKTATFLICGPFCTRSCAFCSVQFAASPPPPDKAEPEKICNLIEALGLSHVVITMTSRDDLEDKGVGHLLECVDTVKKHHPKVTLELLTSDFDGKREAWNLLAQNKNFEIFNHNLETVARLAKKIRHRATYEQSLSLLSFMKRPHLFVKSGIMVGLGETKDEVIETLKDLKKASCDIVTIGQYLRPNRKKIPPHEYIRPEVFQEYEHIGKDLGLPFVLSGPFVRSSYNAQEILKEVSQT